MIEVASNFRNSVFLGIMDSDNTSKMQDFNLKSFIFDFNCYLIILNVEHSSEWTIYRMRQLCIKLDNQCPIVSKIFPYLNRNGITNVGQKSSDRRSDFPAGFPIDFLSRLTFLGIWQGALEIFPPLLSSG